MSFNGCEMAKDFSDEIKIKALLWCNRHCCLCGKACGTDIEIAHIVPKGKGGTTDIDNAIPLCYNCHSEIGKYNKEHPRGNKYRPEELRARREQIYEEQTRHLVPPISYGVTQRLPGGSKRQFPDVGFHLSHYGDSLPVKVKVILDILLAGRSLGNPDAEYYGGGKLWHLNPRSGHMGHFKIPQEAVDRKTERLDVKASVTIIDQYGREHKLLPVGWVYMRKENDWYFEPSEPE